MLIRDAFGKTRSKKQHSVNLPWARIGLFPHLHASFELQGFSAAAVTRSWKIHLLLRYLCYWFPT